MSSQEQQTHGSLLTYSTGFVLSIILTLIPFFLITRANINGWGLTAALAGFAVIQLGVQAVFFLHLTDEPKPRWNSMIFAFMLLVVGIVVIGSLWIMANLEYHHADPAVDAEYLLEDEGIRR